MTESEIYIEICERYIDSAEKELNTNNPNLEVVAFKLYHSYESIASAFTKHFGEKISINHSKKLTTFLTIAKRNSNRGLIRYQNIGYLNILFEYKRNKYLYPEEEFSGQIKSPKEQINQVKINDLKSRINGIYRIVKPII